MLNNTFFNNYCSQSGDIYVNIKIFDAIYCIFHVECVIKISIFVINMKCRQHVIICTQIDQISKQYE